MICPCFLRDVTVLYAFGQKEQRRPEEEQQGQQSVGTRQTTSMWTGTRFLHQRDGSSDLEIAHSHWCGVWCPVQTRINQRTKNILLTIIVGWVLHPIAHGLLEKPNVGEEPQRTVFLVRTDKPAAGN